MTVTELVIFDCDGVLVDSEPVANALLIDNLSGYGLHLTPEDCERMFVGGTMAGAGETARRMGADLPRDWVDRIYAQLYARLAEGVPAVPGIVDLLDRLDAESVPYCVASNGSIEKMRITLGQTGLWDRFADRMFSAHLLGVAKPDPGLFLAAARKMGIGADHCTVIEDSLNGVTAAARAGMTCLAYLPSGDGARLKAAGARIIRSMDEVPAALNL